LLKIGITDPMTNDMLQVMKKVFFCFLLSFVILFTSTISPEEEINASSFKFAASGDHTSFQEINFEECDQFRFQLEDLSCVPKGFSKTLTKQSFYILEGKTIIIQRITLPFKIYSIPPPYFS
jgi:hypothetical protein